MSKKKDNKRVADIRNPKAARDYELGERFEAGIALTGTEVKALRNGRGNIADAFVRIDSDMIPTLYHAHISEYDFGNTHNHNPYRPRKILLHAKEIRRLAEETKVGGKTIVPLKIYFAHGLAKLLIAVGKGKKLYDKRADIKKRDDERTIRRALGRRR
ncbi:MAG: SsrA-binding protein SmpB [Opitutae bacterium]|nr:SsrA-binding protein SmpB [Opitutae bacterium]